MSVQLKGYAASAISAEAAFWFAAYAGGLTGERFMTVLRRLLRGRRKPLHLILDGLPTYQIKAVIQYVEELDGKLTL